jgi:hypothetical protein
MRINIADGNIYAARAELRHAAATRSASSLLIIPKKQSHPPAVLRVFSEAKLRRAQASR